MEHAIDANQCIAFVKEHGGDIEKALVDVIQENRPVQEGVAALIEQRDKSGAYHCVDMLFPDAIPTVHATWVALELLAFLNPLNLDKSVLRPTATFLRERQTAEGYWEESEDVIPYNPPGWMLPAISANRLRVTASVIAKGLEVGIGDAIDTEKALHYIRKEWQGTKFPVYLQPHWMMIGFYSLYTRLTKEDSAILTGCKKYIFNSILAERIDAAYYPAIGHAAFLAGAWAKDLFKLAMDQTLLHMGDDGGVASASKTSSRVKGTLELLFLLKKLSLL